MSEYLKNKTERVLAQRNPLDFFFNSPKLFLNFSFSNYQEIFQEILKYQHSSFLRKRLLKMSSWNSKIAKKIKTIFLARKFKYFNIFSNEIFQNNFCAKIQRRQFFLNWIFGQNYNFGIVCKIRCISAIIRHSSKRQVYGLYFFIL